MSASEAVRAAVANMEAIDLESLESTMALQTRMDRKYFVPASTFASFAALMSGELVALDIGGRRLFDYESVYFDSPDLETYRAHVQRRRRRYKVRTRTYVDSSACMLEVKLEGHRSATVKRRTAYEFASRHRLDREAHAFIASVLAEAYGRTPPHTLTPSLVTRYRRATLASRSDQARLTCDVGLVCDLSPTGAGPSSLRANDDVVLVESKSGPGGSVADRMLREMGVRPVSISKYCVGVGGLTPSVASNPWHSTLRRYFDWAPS